jgi:hypothetical protein
MSDGGMPKIIRLEPDALVLGVGLALEPRNEPAHLVPDRAQEDRHLGVRSRRLVDGIRAGEEQQRAAERHDPRDQPSAIDPQDLALMAGDRP